MDRSPHQPARILDANANRAREAFRVMEDAARFLLDDRSLTERLKALRHEVAGVVGTLPTKILDAQRSVRSDAGRDLSTPTELVREDAEAVVRAAAARGSEALRSLEEWSKTLRPETALRFEQLRYRAYETASALVSRLRRPSPQWRVCLLLSESACRRPWQQVLDAAIEGGVDCIQVREKALPDGQLLDRVRVVLDRARPRGVSVVVNDRVDLALAAGADGVHLGQGDLPCDEARDLAGERLLIGVSTHDEQELSAAIGAGCDLVGVGSIFPSTTKPGLESAGLRLVEGLLADHPGLPHLAIGGIGAPEARRLSELGCKGVAVSAAICGAEDPLAASREIVAAMDVREPSPGPGS